MLDAVKVKLMWLEEDLSRLMEPHGICMSQVKTLLSEIRAELISVGRPGDFLARCQEMNGVGDLALAVNAIGLCAGFMMNEPDNYPSIIDQLCVAVRMHERFQNGNLQAQVLPKVFDELLIENRSKQAKHAASIRYGEDDKQREKQFVYECWKDWRADPARYRSKAAFARDVIQKCEHIVSQKKVEDWCRDWEKSEPC